MSLSEPRFKIAGIGLAMLSLVLLTAARISGRVGLAIGAACAGALSIICSAVSWIIGE